MLLGIAIYILLDGFIHSSTFDFLPLLFFGAIFCFYNDSKNLLDWIGRKYLLSYFAAPAELIEIESKLSTEDQEKKELQNYSPQLFSPNPLEVVTYVEDLPILFQVREATLEQNIADVPKLLVMMKAPAYEALRVIKDEAAPKFPTARPVEPKSIAAPINWNRWKCSQFVVDVDVPYYKGLWTPLNYFVNQSYKDVIYQAKRVLRITELIVKRNTEVEHLHLLASQKYESAKKDQAEKWAELKKNDQERVDVFFQAYISEKTEIERLVSLANEVSGEGLLARAEQTLKLEILPSFIPSEFSLKLDVNSKILLLEHQYPDIGALVWIKEVLLKGGLTIKSATQKEAKDAGVPLYPSLSLRLACELARLDKDNIIDAVVVNGWANYTQKSTGQIKRAYCSSLFASKLQLLNLNLAAVDPLVAFLALKGVAARSLDLTPIAPIMRLNTEDKRFVDAKEILSHMANGENLATMDWEDFEHLCRELFEKAFADSGAEVKVTQASRDQGVDAVIFDPDIIRGGKIVVQAKRYTNIVGVSAVRDLYGATMNEGANKGILVTTSHYGPDAYEFAKDKPITLLNGEELLGLLQQYGYSFKIDLVEAKRLNAESGN